MFKKKQVFKVVVLIINAQGMLCKVFRITALQSISYCF